MGLFGAETHQLLLVEERLAAVGYLVPAMETGLVVLVTAVQWVEVLVHSVHPLAIDRQGVQSVQVALVD